MTATAVERNPALTLRGHQLEILQTAVVPTYFPAAFLTAAHLFRCASAIRFRAAALSRRRLRGCAADSADVPSDDGRDVPRIPNIALTLAICSSSFDFCASSPSNAA